ncbi:MAG: hypothetical protein ACFFDY_01435 [Candidatus Thorarchaeota archaeon]
MKVIKYILISLVIIIGSPIWIPLGAVEFGVCVANNGFKNAIEKLWNGE